MKPTWAPELYTMYSDHRYRPNIDLFQYLPKNPHSILDLGCGNAIYSTKLLSELCPNSKITAVDYSNNMLEEAKKNLISNNVSWIDADIRTFRPNQFYDVICIASTLQWVAEHENLLKYYFNFLNHGGRLLIQMPNMFDKPFYLGILETAKNLGFHDLLQNLRKSPVLMPSEYDMILSDISDNYHIWSTTYFQKLNGKDSLLQWAKGAPLRPVITALTESQLHVFYHYYCNLLKTSYFQTDAYSILPFERLFLVAYKS